MTTTLLITHGLVAIILLGGLTHQAMAVCWPARDNDGFFSAFRAVRGASYTNAMIATYVASVLLGGLIYPAYRLHVRSYLEAAQLWEMNGTFEIKEQLVAVGLGMLPFYWYVWQKPLDEKLASARRVVTAMLCFIVWYGFLAGHILNNVRGLYGR